VLKKGCIVWGKKSGGSSRGSGKGEEGIRVFGDTTLLIPFEVVDPKEEKVSLFPEKNTAQGNGGGHHRPKSYMFRKVSRWKERGKIRNHLS